MTTVFFSIKGSVAKSATPINGFLLIRLASFSILRGGVAFQSRSSGMLDLYLTMVSRSINRAVNQPTHNTANIMFWSALFIIIIMSIINE